MTVPKQINNFEGKLLRLEQVLYSAGMKMRKPENVIRETGENRIHLIKRLFNSDRNLFLTQP
jgi:hypothetical protein